MASKSGKRYKQLKEAGLCTMCGQCPPAPGKFSCDPCRAKRKAKLDKKLADGQCAWSLACKEPRYKQNRLCQQHLQQMQKLNRRWIKDRTSTGLCVYCDEPLKPGSKYYCKEHAALTTSRSGAWAMQVKEETLEAYGGARCICCGETCIQLLTIDHGNDDGKRHRMEVSGNFYHRLKKQGFPQDLNLRVMCYSCNIGRYRNGGVCPHEEQRQNIIKNILPFTFCG